ncbi:hypothetical protein [Methylophilus aquaticus]|uniref:DUF4760 domain-containing protein n=1 Tax=Methylophilus aquaticus TaxID=1971610 RepID=A0ABT9JQE4_9PROT|nr:hypothetical protein [Methylophilus aquaticus]MDP8566787.1 hypothetical protein [Methylophilus aquaticus]
MFAKTCYWYFCFTPISIPNISERIFGFSEYLTAVALLAVLFTITDFRFKFRLAVTPSHLYRNSYVVLALIGILSLLTEVWIAEEWFVPVTVGLDYHIWQMMLGLLFLVTFLTWIYYAFINPPIFGKRNAHKYAVALYKVIVKSSNEELKVIADELARSASTLIKYVESLPRHPTQKNKADYKDFAHDILLLMGNRRLCKYIVATSQVTAQAFFDEMVKGKKYNIPIIQFARNILTEAISQKESFLYSEGEDGIYSGLLGYLKPVSNSLYGNFTLIETLALNGFSPFDVDYDELRSWDSNQWKAYCRAALMTINSYLVDGNDTPQFSSIRRVCENVKHACIDLRKLDGMDSTYESEIAKTFSVLVEFVKQIIELINKQPNPPWPIPKVDKGRYTTDIYDLLANLIFEFCFQAATVKSPRHTSWELQFNIVWESFFGSERGATWSIVRYKVRRQLYDSIVKLNNLPNYKSSRVLGFCLNILIDANKPTNQNYYDRADYPLAKAVQNWTNKNYLQLRKINSDIADSVLLGSISFDEKGRRLVKTYSKGLRTEEPKTYLNLRVARSRRKPPV